MNESLADRYRSIPYVSCVHEFTHPRYLGAMGRLFGLPTAEPETARVLELATGRGQNILWIARTLPQSQCLAMDLVEEGFLEAKQKAAGESLDHLQFVAADLLECDLAGQQFDYIIAHGFFSWTIPEVQQRIFEVCRDHLAENGMAMISYNALPGCLTSDALRQLFLLELGDLEPGASADEQLQAVDRAVNLLEATMPEIEGLPHSYLLEKEIKDLRRKEGAVLLHDECGVIHDPVYLQHFTQRASEKGLAYIADMKLLLDHMPAWPEKIRQSIAAFRLPRLKAIQYADYVFNNSFRRSLLCRAADANHLNETPQPQALESLWITSYLRVHGRPPKQREDPIRYEGTRRFPHTPDKLLEISDPMIKEFVGALGYKQSYPLAEIKQHISEQLGAEFTEDSSQRLLQFILQSICAERMQVSLGPLPKAEHYSGF